MQKEIIHIRELLHCMKPIIPDGHCVFDEALPVEESTEVRGVAVTNEGTLLLLLWKNGDEEAWENWQEWKEVHPEQATHIFHAVYRKVHERFDHYKKEAV